MILSDKDIKKYIEFGRLEISDFSEVRLSPASYNFRLGSLILIPGEIDVIDPKSKSIQDYEEVEIGEGGFRFESGAFILAQTMEHITLNPALAMTIEGRSTFARTGIEVTMTSTFIEPDHSNSIITMELKNNGNNAVQLYKGMELFKGIFHQLSSETDETIGKKSSYSATLPQNKPLPPKL